MTPEQELGKLRTFVAQIARMTKDQECPACQSREEENAACQEHELWDMPNDDAVDTVHSLISEAREMSAAGGWA